MIKLLLVLLLWSNDTKTEYCETLLPLTLEIERCSGVSHVWLLAHSALETGYNSKPKGNNFFGVKALRNQPYFLGKTIEYLDKPRGKVVDKIILSNDTLYKCQVWERFRFYPSKRDSFEDYTRLLTTKSTGKSPRQLLPEFCGSNYMTSPDCSKALELVIVQIESTLYQIRCLK